MDKTLDMVALLHRIIIGVALALFIVGVSIHRPNDVYDAAESELQSLQDGIEAVSEQVNGAYKAIYDKSELKASTVAWLRRRNAAQRNLDIQAVSSADFRIPDSTQDPLVTLDAQVKWADRVYRELDNPFFLCAVDRDNVFHALDKVFAASAKPKFTQLNVYVRSAKAGAGANKQFSCQVELQYEVQIGTLTGLRSAILDLPTTVIEVMQVELSGPKWVDLEIAGTLKEHGLGDFEDAFGLVIPALREFWTDIGDRSPDAAMAFLRQKKEDETEKSKEKIEILGGSLSGSLTIMMTSLVELCLMVYLLAYLVQVRTLLLGHGVAIFESPFFGVMRSGLGRLTILFTFLFPLGVCFFVLAYQAI
jgi:hypothetical protein